MLEIGAGTGLASGVLLGSNTEQYCHCSGQYSGMVKRVVYLLRIVVLSTAPAEIWRNGAQAVQWRMIDER